MQWRNESVRLTKKLKDYFYFCFAISVRNEMLLNKLNLLPKRAPLFCGMMSKL